MREKHHRVGADRSGVERVTSSYVYDILCQICNDIVFLLTRVQVSFQLISFDSSTETWSLGSIF